jgi:hypothetical protein
MNKPTAALYIYKINWGHMVQDDDREGKRKLMRVVKPYFLQTVGLFNWAGASNHLFATTIITEEVSFDAHLDG